MQDSSRPVTGYPVQNLDGCAPPPPVTGYAYAAVNGNAYPYQPASPPQKPRPTFLRRLLAALAVGFIIFGVILFIIWLVIRPELPDFSVQSLSLSDFNASNQRVNATWSAQFQVSNSNKKLSILFGDTVSSIFHKDYFLSETTIGPFKQGTRSTAPLEASYSLVNAFVAETVVDEMNGERSGGQMKFNLKVVADVAFRYGGWSGRQRYISVLCADVAVNASSGKMNGGPQECIVF